MSWPKNFASSTVSRTSRPHLLSRSKWTSTRSCRTRAPILTSTTTSNHRTVQSNSSRTRRRTTRQIRGRSGLKQRRRSKFEKEKTKKCKQIWKRIRNRSPIAEEVRKKSDPCKSSSWLLSTTRANRPSANTLNHSVQMLIGTKWAILMWFTIRSATTSSIIRLRCKIRQSQCRQLWELPTTSTTEAETRWTRSSQTSRGKKVPRCQFRIWLATRAGPRTFSTISLRIIAITFPTTATSKFNQSTVRRPKNLKEK